MTKIMAGELRQSTDAADSVKAFYAAQSASEDAILHLKTSLAGGNLTAADNYNCTSSLAGLTNINGITCASIDAAGTNTIDKNISSDEGQTYYLPAGVTTLNVSWDLAESDGSSVAATSHDTNGLGWAGAPPLEVTFAPYTPPNRTASAFNKRVLWPQPSAAITIVSFSAATLIPDVLCNQSGLACKNITLTNFNVGGQNLVMRIYPRFRNAHVVVTDPGGHTIYPSNATIDITARIGDSYRRTITEINVRANPFATLGNVVQGDDQVCKTFKQSQIPPNINSLQDSGFCLP